MAGFSGSSKQQLHVSPDEIDNLSTCTSISTLTPSDDGSLSPPTSQTSMGISSTVKSMGKKDESEELVLDLEEDNNTGKKKNDEDTGTSGSEEQEKFYDVEEIISHKSVRGKDFWKVRWAGYGPESDTWEPTENLISENAKLMRDDYQAKQLAKKEQRKEMARKSKEYKKEQRRKEKEGKKKKGATGTDDKKEGAEASSTEDEEDDDEQQADLDGSNVEGWFGIKPGQGPREQQRLFVPDRRLSKTEKLLTEINASPGVRVLRNHLKSEERSRLSAVEVTPLRKRGRPQKETPKKKKGPIGATQNDLFDSESSSPARIGEATGGKKKKQKKAVDKTDQPDLDSKKEEEEEQAKIDVAKDDDAAVVEQAKKAEDEAEKTEIKGKKQQIGKRQKETELGISKKLKPTFLKRKREAPIAKEAPAEKQPAGPSQPPPKLKGEKRQQTKQAASGADLALKALPEGANIAGEFEKILTKIQARKVDDQECSQQQFEEIVMDGKVEKVRDILLLNSQKQPAPFLDLDHVDDLGKTLIHKLCEIKCGVTHTQCELIDLLISNGARLDIRETNNGQIPLHIAIANRRLCHVQKLLSFHAPVNSLDRADKSPLMLALDSSSDYGFLRFLLRAGASFHLVLEKIYRDKDRYKRQMRIITEHETRLRRALNSARDIVTLNMTVKCISPIFVNPLHEGEAMQHFHLSSQPQLPGQDYAYMLFVGTAEFVPDERNKEFCSSIEARMWGKCPVACAQMNGKECVPLKPGNNFAFFCVPCRDQNQIRIKFVPEMQNTQLILLSQVVLVQFHGGKEANGR